MTLSVKPPEVGVNSKTVPQPDVSSSPSTTQLVPPSSVVPYKFPAESKMTPEDGKNPSLTPINLYAMLSVQTPAASVSLNTVPQPTPLLHDVPPPSFVVP